MPDAAPMPDAYSPGVVVAMPAANSTVNPSTAVRVTFDVDVAGVSLTSFLVSGTAGPVTGAVTYDPGLKMATFATTEGLPPNDTITVTLTSEIIDPLTNRTLMATMYMFNTSADTTAPTVVMTTPANGQTGVSVGTNLSMRFSEPVVGISGTTMQMIETASSAVVVGTVTYDAPTRTATFDPQDQLTPNLSYTGSIQLGVTDVAGNPMSPLATGFMTGPDFVAPAVRVTMPANMDAGVPVTANVVVTFDEAVANVSTTSFQLNGGAIAGTVTMSNGNKTATFDPTADLPGASTITVTLSTAITDTSSNALAATMFSFTTN